MPGYRKKTKKNKRKSKKSVAKKSVAENPIAENPIAENPVAEVSTKFPPNINDFLIKLYSFYYDKSESVNKNFTKFVVLLNTLGYTVEEAYELLFNLFPSHGFYGMMDAKGPIPPEYMRKIIGEKKKRKVNKTKN